MTTHRSGHELSLRARRRSFVLSEASLLATSAAVVWVGLAWLELESPFQVEDVRVFLVATSISSALLGICSILSLLGGRGVLPLLFAAWSAWAVPLALKATEASTVAFVAFAWAAVTTYFVLRLGVSPRRASVSRDDAVGALWSPSVLFSGLCGLLLTAMAVGHRLTLRPIGSGAVLGLLLVPSIFASLAEWALVRRGLLGAWKATLLTLVTLAGCLLFWFSLPFGGPGAAHIILAARVVVAIFGAFQAHETHQEVVAFLWRRPALLVVLTFVVLCAVGGIVLKFPACTTRPIALIDALFTSVSAACVTGLVVLDTPVDFTFTGQAVIVVIIQIGGLGIMTLSAFAALFLGRSFGSQEEQGLSEMVGASTPMATVRMVRSIVVSTLVIEGAGALILFPAFWAHGSEPLAAAWKAVFHSVSAFCNAGFALQSDNLMAYKSNPLVLHTISALIILGGLGFGVLAGLFDILRGRARKLSLHAKLVLSTTGVLLVTAFLLFLVLEWSYSLSTLTFSEKLHNSWLQGVTYRTAGFNSVDFTRLAPASIYLGMIFMFIGASPASTGGGIKTTTAAVLVLAVRAVLSRSSDVQAFNRRIPVDVVYRAAAVAALSAVFIVAGTAILLHTQTIPFHSICFEAFSAFGTVGVSVGATLSLDPLGKIVIMTLMLAGRTGPLTMAVLFHQAPPKRLRYTAEEVMVG